MALVRDTGGSTFPLKGAGYRAGGSGSSGTSYTTTGGVSTGAAAGRLVVSVVLANFNGTNMGAPVLSGGGLTWAKRAEGNLGGSNDHVAQIWEADWSGGALSGVNLTLTWTSASTNFVADLVIDAYTGAGSGGATNSATLSGTAANLNLAGTVANSVRFVALAYEDASTAVTPVDANTVEIEDWDPTSGVKAAVGIHTAGSGTINLGWSEAIDFGALAAYELVAVAGGGGTSNVTDAATPAEVVDLVIATPVVPERWRQVFRGRFAVVNAAPNTLPGNLTRQIMLAAPVVSTTVNVTDAATPAETVGVLSGALANVADTATPQDAVAVAQGAQTPDAATPAEQVGITLTVRVTDAATPSDSATIPSGGTDVAAGTVSGHWTLSGSPYRINGNINVPKGSTLAIDPGVQIEFQGSYSFILYGGLSAVGTSGARIRFTTATSDRIVAEGGSTTRATWVGWRGIRVGGDEGTIGTGSDPVDHGAGTWTLKFCDIDYVDKYNGGTAAHPWNTYLGSFYAHGYYVDDLVLEDIDVHHQRSDGICLLPGNYEWGSVEAHYWRIRVYGSDTKTGQSNGDGFDAQHFNHPLGSNVAVVHFHDCEVYDTNNGNTGSPFVAYTWDAKILFHNLVIGTGALGYGVGANEAAWFLTSQPNDWVRRQADPTDAATPTESVGVSLTVTSTSNVTDTATPSDSVGVTQVMRSDVADAATPAETVGAALVLRADVIDAATPSETAGVGVAFPAAVADTATPSEVVAATVVLRSDVSDAATPSESVGASVTGSGTSANTDTATPAEQVAVGLGVQTGDTATPSDAVGVTLTFPSAVSDGATPAEAVGVTLTLVSAVADTATPTDSTGVTQGAIASVSDGATPSEAVGITLTLGVGDTATPSEVVAATIAIRVDVADAATPADQIATATTARTSDTATPADSTGVVIGPYSTVSDGATPTEVVTVQVVFNVAIADAATPQEAPAIAQGVRVVDTASATEVIYDAITTVLASVADGATPFEVVEVAVIAGALRLVPSRVVGMNVSPRVVGRATIVRVEGRAVRVVRGQRG